ncbi:hypothetical protein AMATHDRAFT_58418 [Amanita thiersii Skay4041]|uniref:Uncharacterized protein n=1 Tax=Amanita thiersii Skay4041 TaxID=703135 RepID=A0A2A9NNJ0_9AGAR|nr:hypothetical protein AMATHDRAFT_58418 [Amanita thiersii Skay4041]
MLLGPFVIFALCQTQLPAAQFNRTIDDTFGDQVTGKRPLFLPNTTGVWGNKTCNECKIQPDPALAFHGTWAAAAYQEGLENISIALDFTGVAIYAFFTLSSDAVTNCEIVLDYGIRDLFIHWIEPTLNKMEYNTLIYSKTGLENKAHQLLISTAPLLTGYYLSFDFAIYTTDDSPTPNTTIPPFRTSQTCRCDNPRNWAGHSDLPQS